MLNYKLQSNMT
jgi:hypothetical protein